MKEVLYSPWTHLVGTKDVWYAPQNLIDGAKKFLSKNADKSSSGSSVIYFYDGCLIKDLNNLGLKICSEYEDKINSLVSKLFPKDNASRA